jgi:DNA ligase (NAD+)
MYNWSSISNISTGEAPLNRQEAEKRITELRDEIELHDRKYYIEDNPVISDFEYDKLMES